MTSSDETGHITGTKDKDYNIIWFTEACLSNALRPPPASPVRPYLGAGTAWARG